MSIIIGYNNPQILMTNSGDANTTTLSLPLTNLTGRQVEQYEYVGWNGMQVDLSLDRDDVTRTELMDVYGVFITWNLSYSDFIQGTDLINFQSIIEGAFQGDTFQLIPRSDESWRYFDVNLVLNPFAVGIATGGSNAPFNKDFTISFKTKNMVKLLKWAVVIPPDTRIMYYRNNQAFMRAVV